MESSQTILRLNRLKEVIGWLTYWELEDASGN